MAAASRTVPWAQIVEAARGRWREILATVGGIPRELLDGRHHPCPRSGCGGKDRFRLIDDVDGRIVCNQCCPDCTPGGLKTLEWYTGWPFAECCRRVAEYLGLAPPAGGNGRTTAAPPPVMPSTPPAAGQDQGKEAPAAEPSSNGRGNFTVKRAKLRAMSASALPDHPRLRAYLRHRGLSIDPPASLRLAESVPYYQTGDGPTVKVGDFPAIIALVQSPGGQIVGAHRTYLSATTDGKAEVADPKKMESLYPGSTSGGAVHLYPADGPTLALTEGIETGLAVREALSDVPAWACLNAGNLAKVELRSNVETVYIMGDNDASGVGQRAAHDAAERLAGWGIDVRMVIPPDPDTDWLDVLVKDGPAAIKHALTKADRVPDHADSPDSRHNPKNIEEKRGCVGATPSGSGVAGDFVGAIESFEPFPVNELPEPVKGFVIGGSKAVGCDPSYVALPLLTALASAIGNTRRLRLKGIWLVPPILWSVLVGVSGSLKTSAFKLALRALRKRQQQAMRRHAEAMQRYKATRAAYERELAAWKRECDASQNDPPQPPIEPQAVRYIVVDTTVEAIAPLLRSNERGILLERDELNAWFGSFDRYANGKGSDASCWLSMYNGEPILSDRRGSPSISVPRASVCIAGGIQPDVLRRAIGREHRENGLLSRLLLAYPPQTAKRWTDADIDAALESSIEALLDRLFDLGFGTDPDGESCPIVVDLAPEAKRVWIDHYNSHAKELRDLSGDLASAWAKLEETPARLALVIHFIRWAASDSTLCSADTVDAKSMTAGVQLANWFKREARRVYRMLDETEREREQRNLVDWIHRKGGRVTPRDAQRQFRRFRDADSAETALNSLVQSGYGYWDDVPTGKQGGRPYREFVLRSADATPSIPSARGNGADITPQFPEKTGVVSAVGAVSHQTSAP